MTLLRLVNNSMFRMFTRDLRGVSRKASEQLVESSRDQSFKNLQTVTLPQSEETKKSYRTFKQKVKNLKKNCSCQMVTRDNQFEMVKKAVTMFHHLPYSEQLELKQIKHQELIQRLKNNKIIRHQVQCKVDEILASPQTVSYRNKDMFSVGQDIQGKITVGYHVGGRREGVVCVEPSPLQIIKSEHKQIAALYSEFLSEIDMTRVSMYQGEKKGWNYGSWSEIMVRSNLQGQLMIKVLYFTNDCVDEKYEDEKKRMVEKFLSSGLPISSIYVNETSTSHERNSVLLHGDANFIEKIGALKMSLGPNTFCQINRECAELLLDVVERGVVVGRNRTLLDLCCGAGMFSLHLSPYFRGAIGLDLEDTRYASENAGLNNLRNCRFLTGRIQSILPNLLTDLKTQSVGVSAVLNPGRSGVDQTVIEAIRRFPLLDNIVYISCQPEDQRVIGNLTKLMSPDSKNTPSKYESKPFTLRSATALDMFPQTHHCEHVFVFRR